MEYIKFENQPELSNEGVMSRQILTPHNSKSGYATITKVKVAPNAVQPRHQHDSSEQIWTALKGSALLLLTDNQTLEFNQGDVVRFEKGDIHGLENNSDSEFEYLSVTTPPINFSYAYKKQQ